LSLQLFFLPTQKKTSRSNKKKLVALNNHRHEIYISLNSEPFLSFSLIKSRSFFFIENNIRDFYALSNLYDITLKFLHPRENFIPLAPVLLFLIPLAPLLHAAQTITSASICLLHERVYMKNHKKCLIQKVIWEKEKSDAFCCVVEIYVSFMR
jgi:hypothetical protein